MEFNEKLQELRHQRGLTQEELAHRLYVSRTAISKWESGRGYPSIESLKAIASFFSVTVDDLLSTNEVISLAEKDGKEREGRLRDLIYGLLDICMALLLFMPFFASRVDGEVEKASLLSLDGVQTFVTALFFIAVTAIAVMGVLILALQSCQGAFWMKNKIKISLSLGVVAVLLFTLSLQPYAAVFAFALLAIKALILIKF